MTRKALVESTKKQQKVMDKSDPKQVPVLFGRTRTLNFQYLLQILPKKCQFDC